MRLAFAVGLTVATLMAGSLAPAVAAGPESVSGLAAKLSPSVVNISTTMNYEGMGLPFPRGPEGTPLDDMLEELNPNFEFGPDAMQEARSMGSGFIISADGLIVTNNHVISGASEILVMLSDGTRLEATLVGADDKSDLAVLKVTSETDLPFVELGDSDTALVGDWVMAIGNPFGLGGSVSLGIVSARNRDINSGPYDDFIQTDAAINQGSSGGPLFDMNGKVVGINTAIMAAGGSSLGIGFSVPVNLARPVVAQLAEFGETRRGWLGVAIEEVSEDVARSLDRDTRGARVVEITPTSPAEGLLQPGDIIVDFNGRSIVRMRDLPRSVASTAVGEKVKVTVERDGKKLVFDVTLGRLEDGEKLIASQRQPTVPDMPDIPSEPPVVETDAAPAELPLEEIVGFATGLIGDEDRDTFNIAADLEGVLITRITEGSDAEQQGLLTGFVITDVNGQPVTTPEEVFEIVESASAAGRPAVVVHLYDPAGTERYAAVKLLR
jgi:serine protease Do